ncbi:MAG: YidC/Oxa1 family membrane protein insertase [Clostridia bacterium]|nr:YidC/Oxa1 family membrane protein insertase [Clostridia bacterium]
MMDFIISIPGYVLRFCNNIMGNQYILALFIFAIIIEVLLLPFGIKQQKNSIKQAKLRPKEMAIRKKYAGRDDQPTKQKMTQEIQDLYQKEGFNPMGGCLPMLIQFPIIIILYQIVIKPLNYICGLSEEMINAAINVVKSFSGYENVTFNAGNNINLMGAIKDVLGRDPHAFDSIEGFSEKISSAADLPNLSSFGLDFLNLGQTPGFTTVEGRWLLWVPILTFVVYFLSMKLNRKLSYQPMADDQATGCSNKMMDIVMPLFSVWITFSVPAALGVYWIFKSILGVIKQWILKKAMPIPTFTEEDYKAAEKEMNARMEKAPKAKSGRVVRSLHHIDDEDFADTAEKARKHKEALAAQEAAEAEARKNAPTFGSLLSGVKKKEDKSEQSEQPEQKEKGKKSKKKESAGLDDYQKSMKEKLGEKKESADTKESDQENKTDGEEQ